MTRVFSRVLLLAVVAAAPAWSQFALYFVNGNVEQPVGPVYSLGSVEPGSMATVPFRIRNISTAAASLNLLTVSGAGFTLATPFSPLTLASQASVDFTVVFQPSGSGTYSAFLESVGISVSLTATAPVELTCLLNTSTGTEPLAASPPNFGSVTLGAAATLQITLLNQTNSVLIAPGPIVTGAGFALSGPSPGGAPVQPTASVGFAVQFTPTASGLVTGQLAIGDRTYPLIGTGVAPALPQPQISLSLPQPDSAQQGTVAINLATPSQTSGTGTVTLTFLPTIPLADSVADPGIAFASSGQSATFTVSPGDTQGHFSTGLTAPFQTGTTAGTLTVTAQLGGTATQQSVTILPAVVGVTAARGVLSTGSIEVDLTGFDNTRTAGALSFTFFDPSGKALGSGPISADGTSLFASYFKSSAGGTFELKAVFPVAGDFSQISEFQAAVTNSAGSATTTRISF
jgi:hypothetical protein